MPSAIEAEFAAAWATYAECRSIEDVHAELKAADTPVYTTPLAAAS
jgi:hypothetical protein